MSESTPLPTMAEAFPDMVASAAPAAAPAPAGGERGTTTYTLPGGVIIVAGRPTNKLRRILVDQPDQAVKFMLDTIAASCIRSMSFPADYDDSGSEAATFSFDPKEVKASNYNRLDDLSLVDTQAYSAAFEERNTPTKPMVEDITKAISQAKAAKKSA